MNAIQLAELQARVKKFASALEETGGNVVAAGEAAGIKKTMAYRWFNEGIPAVGLAPLAPQFRRVTKAARVARVAGEVREQFAKVIETRAEETGAVVRREEAVRDEEVKAAALMRGGLIQDAAMVVEYGVRLRRLLPVLLERLMTEQPLQERMVAWTRACVDAGCVTVKGKVVGAAPPMPYPLPTFGVESAGELIEQYGRIAGKLADAVDRAITAERRLIGAPTEVIGLAGVPAAMSVEEMEERVVHFQRVIEHVKSVGGYEHGPPRLSGPVIGEVVDDV